MVRAAMPRGAMQWGSWAGCAPAPLVLSNQVWGRRRAQEGVRLDALAASRCRRVGAGQTTGGCRASGKSLQLRDRYRSAPPPRRRSPPRGAFAAAVGGPHVVAASASGQDVPLAPGPSAARLPRPRWLGLDLPLRDGLPVQTGDHAIEQALPHSNERVALANAHVGRITRADPGRGQGLV